MYCTTGPIRPLWHGPALGMAPVLKVYVIKRAASLGDPWGIPGAIPGHTEGPQGFPGRPQGDFGAFPMGSLGCPKGTGVPKGPFQGTVGISFQPQNVLKPDNSQQIMETQSRSIHNLYF